MPRRRASLRAPGFQKAVIEIVAERETGIAEMVPFQLGGFLVKRFGGRDHVHATILREKNE